MKTFSPLQKHRQQYNPPLPPLLHDLKKLQSVVEKKAEDLSTDPALLELFPHTSSLPHLHFQNQSSGALNYSPLKVGVVLSGGQAPGGQNVISGLWDALKKIHSDSQLIGFLEGPGGIIKNKYIDLTEEAVAPFRNQGGFDIIGSGRTKIETPEQFEAAGQTLIQHGLHGLVIIGGDDSNTNAAFLAEFCNAKNIPTRIIGVPKTIDGDLKNQYIETPFGFDTASKIYAEFIGNLAKDALSQKKYYFFVKMMGRSASHLTLECALQTQINLALIGEEIVSQGKNLAQVVKDIADLICERAERNKNFGVILIPEGILEFIPDCLKVINELNRFLTEHPEIAQKIVEMNVVDRQTLIQKSLTIEAYDCFSRLPEDIQKQLLLDRDPHGNIQLSKIESERLLITLVEKELNERQQQTKYRGKFNAQPLFCGYEGRSGLPSNFDCQYCYALGHLAALLIHHQASGYLCCIKNLSQSVENWEIMGVPIVQMLHFELRNHKKMAVIKKHLVDLKGPVFAAFQKQKNLWRLDDLYCCPGPIQFEGPSEIKDSPTLTLRLEEENKK